MVTKKTGWTTVAFGDVVRLSKERANDPAAEGFERFVGLEHLEPGDLRIRSWGDVADGTTFTSVFRPGHVLFGKRRAYQRKVAVADFSGVCSGDIYVLEPKDGHLLPELLPFICQTDSFFEHAVGTSAGSLSPRTNWTSLADFKFGLPPIEEQRRLVAALSGVEVALNTQRVLVDSLTNLRQASIDHFTALSGMENERLSEHCEMQQGRAFPGHEYCDDGVLLLRPGNLSPTGYLDWEPSKTKRLPARHLTEAADFIVGPGDVVINLTAQSLEDGFMGRVCIARDQDRCLLNQRIGRFKSFSNRLLPEYLFRTLQSERFKSYAISMCEGSKIKHLFWQHLAQFPIRLPSLDEQRTVVDTLRIVDQRLAEASTRVQRLMGIKATMLTVLSDSQRKIMV